MRATVSDFIWFGVALAVIWALTPVVASFGTIAFGDRLNSAVFMNGETGSTSGDGPWTLYGMLFRAGVGVWLACLAARLVIERKSSRVEPFFVGAVGAGIGLLYFLYQLVQDSLTPESWYWAPAGFAAGYVVAACLTLWHGSRGASGPKVVDKKVTSRVEGDWRALGAAIAASVTVVVPWLLGRFALRDRLGREAAPEVFDVAARSAGAYFKTDWFAGGSVILLLACLFVVIRPWRGRTVSLVSAGALTAAVLVLLVPVAKDEWKQAEATTVKRLSAEAYPFYDNFLDCGGEEITFTRRDGSKVTWALYLARYTSAPSDVRCDHAVLYQGWRKVANVDFPDGSYEYSGGLCCSADVEVNEGASLDKTRFVVTFGDGNSMTVRLRDYKNQ